MIWVFDGAGKDDRNPHGGVEELGGETLGQQLHRRLARAVHRLHGEREETAHAYEVNEAFAPVPLAWAHELGADPERLNPRGGAIALGRAPVASRWFTSLASRGVPEDPSVENGEQVGARVAELPLHEAVHRSVVEFNRLPTDASPTHRDRMRLILTTPELRAHSVHQYAAWRAAIAAYVARRTGQQPTDLTPRMGGYGLQAMCEAAGMANATIIRRQ